MLKNKALYNACIKRIIYIYMVATLMFLLPSVFYFSVIVYLLWSYHIWFENGIILWPILLIIIPVLFLRILNIQISIETYSKIFWIFLEFDNSETQSCHLFIKQFTIFLKLFDNICCPQWLLSIYQVIWKYENACTRELRHCAIQGDILK